jgi:hypothetical protein
MHQTPHACGTKILCINAMPFYDARRQQYTKILCVNAMPLGALAERVTTVRPARLSGLSGSDNNKNKCIHALTHSCGGAYMTPDELPELFAFLMSNGYAVNPALTKLAKNGNNSLVCIISCTV